MNSKLTCLIFREAVFKGPAQLGNGPADALMRRGEVRGVAEAVTHIQTVVGREAHRGPGGMPSRAAPRLYAFKILHFLVVELAGERAIRKHRAEHALDDAEFLNERPAGHNDGLRGDFLAVQQGHAGAGAFLDTHDGAFLEYVHVFRQGGIQPAQHVGGVHQQRPGGGSGSQW